MADPHVPDPRPTSGVRVVRADRIVRERGSGLAAPELPGQLRRPGRRS